MKVLVEITYNLNSEPDEFKSITDTHTRVVYVWENRRGYLSNTAPWQTYSRLSCTDSQEPPTSFMEVWLDTKDDISDPPHNTDDMWTETYKCIDKNNYTMEWHANHNQLRITWYQSTNTLKDHKIVTHIVSQIENLALTPFPEFPTFDFGT
jgi:hypothetical protein